MELNSDVNIAVPDSNHPHQNDSHDENTAREQKNPNQIVELIMAAFENHDEPSDEDSLNTSGSSHHSSDEQQALNLNNNQNEPNVSQDNELSHPTPTSPVRSSLMPLSDMHVFENSNNDENVTFNRKNHARNYQNSSNLSSNSHFQYLPAVNITDLNNTTQYQINELQKLCDGKDRKIAQLHNLCEKYEKSKYVLERQYEHLFETNHRTIKDSEFRIQQLEVDKTQLEKKVSDSESVTESLHRKLSLDSMNYTELQKQLTQVLEEKTRLEDKCQQLESDIRTLRERINNNESEDNKSNYALNSYPMHDDNSLLDRTITDENDLLKERINEYVYKEKQLREINDELKYKIQEYEQRLKRCDSSSSSSSNETVITTSFHTDQIRKLTNQIELLKKDYFDLQEKSDYEKQELQVIIEQLREDVYDLDKIKQLYLEVCQEKNSIEDTLRTKFEYEFQMKLDELHRKLEKEYDEKLVDYNQNQEQFEGDKQLIERKYQQDFEQQSKEFQQQMDKMKIKHEKQIVELNNQLDLLRTNDDAKNRLVYVEKEFEQLKHDYYNLNLKQSELLKTCSTLEIENENLTNTIETIKSEKIQLTEKYENDIEQLKRINEQEKQQLLFKNNQTDKTENNFKETIQSLESRISNYENIISQYEEYRIKLENNLQKISQQRDTHKVEARLTQQMLISKEQEYQQLKLDFEQFEKDLQTYQEQCTQYETTINNLQRQIQEFNQTRLHTIRETEEEYHEKLVALDREKHELEQRLEQAHRALDLADSHLRQEVEKIQMSLEQDYKRRYERDYKQHQYELQQLTNEFHKQQANNPSNSTLQELEEMKKLYRTEIDRLYRENIDLSQHQSKLIETHQKQMQIMKKELDDGYNNVIKEFQYEQTRLQTRCDQLKQQLNDAQHTIEQLKLNLNQFKTHHYDDISKMHQTYNNENRTRQDNLQNRLDNLVKLLEKSNHALNEERTVNAQQENDYHLTINSLQTKISDMIKQHNKSMDEIRRELQDERSTNRKQRPHSVPEFNSDDFSLKENYSDEITSMEKIRELFTNEMIALLRLICKMIFDVYHKVTIAHYMDNLNISIKKQIHNELLRSRNSMIKEIRREIFEKLTFVLRSQKVPGRIIDMHIFELDRLLTQMMQDNLTLYPQVSSPSLNSTVVSVQITPPRQPDHSHISNSPSSDKSLAPLRKSIECLYITPAVNKPRAPVTSDCNSTLDIDRRPKSASNTYIASQSVSVSSTDKYQRIPNKNLPITNLHKSEDDLITTMESKQENIINSQNHNPSIFHNQEQAHIRQYQQKTNSLPDPSRSRMRSRTTEIRFISNDDDPLYNQQHSLSTNPSTQVNGIRKFVRNSLKLFIAQPNDKPTGK